VIKRDETLPVIQIGTPQRSRRDAEASSSEDDCGDRCISMRSRFSPRDTLRRSAFITAGFDLNLERCKVTSMPEGSQDFALSLPEHDFDSSCLAVEVKSKVLPPQLLAHFVQLNKRRDNISTFRRASNFRRAKAKRALAPFGERGG
jgi:hypothetical protein